MKPTSDVLGQRCSWCREWGLLASFVLLGDPPAVQCLLCTGSNTPRRRQA